MRMLCLLVALLLVPVAAMAQTTTRAVVHIQSVDVRPSGSVWMVVVVWRACALSPNNLQPECTSGETVHSLIVESNGVSNARIENDAKAALLLIGAPVNGAVHVFGGRTS